jgi:hypothetical protein
VSLTPDEKACGRLFRDFCQAALLNGITADAFCPPYIVWYRHECKPGERSVQSGTRAMYLKQVYVLSSGCEAHGVPEGLFAYVYRFGQCPRCDFRVRSGTARFVIAAENPPEKGANVGKSSYREVPGAEKGAQAPS